MALNQIFQSAASGLAAIQDALAVTTNNVANAQSPGYAREKTALAPIVLAGGVAGVSAGPPQRVADAQLDALYWSSSGDAAGAAATDRYLGQLQSSLGAPDGASTLAGRLTAVATAATRLNLDSTSADRAGLLTAIDDAVAAFRDASGEVDSLRAQAGDDVRTSVLTVNDQLKAIATLNDQVRQAQATGRSSAAAETQRATALDALAQEIKVVTRLQPDGRLFVETAGGVTLVDARARQIAVPPPSGGFADDSAAPLAVIDTAANGKPVPTGETLDAVNSGGRLGALIRLRDATLPAVQDRLGATFESFAATVNAVANDGAAAPPAHVLDGRVTGFAGGEDLRLTGRAAVQKTDADGVITGTVTLDFSDPAGPKSADDIVAAINAALGPVASFSGGKLKLDGGAGGIAIAADPASPAMRDGVGLSALLGLNDIIRLPGAAPTTVAATDPHGGDTGQALSIDLVGADGRIRAHGDIALAAGGTIADVVDALNASPLGKAGTFALNGDGRLAFTPNPDAADSRFLLRGDTSRRYGQASLGDLLGFGAGRGPALIAGASVNRSAALAPAGQPDFAAAIGTPAIASGDVRTFQRLAAALSASPVRIDTGGIATATPLAATSLVQAGADQLGAIGDLAARAGAANDQLAARQSEAGRRRAAVSGVNLDEELAQMTVLQNSYAAVARVFTAARDMTDELLKIAG